MFKKLICIALLAASPLAMATSQPQLSLEDSNDYRAQRAKIEKGLADGETYAEISHLDRATVRTLLQRISGRLEGVSSVDELSDQEKADLFNDQEQINVILTQAAADSRMICRSEMATGTRFKKTRCYTVGERRRRTEQDQDDLRKIQNGIGPPNN